MKIVGLRKQLQLCLPTGVNVIDTPLLVRRQKSLQHLNNSAVLRNLTEPIFLKNCPGIGNCCKRNVR